MTKIGYKNKCNKIIRDGIEKIKKIKKMIKHQKRVIKLMRTKLDIKIK